MLRLSSYNHKESNTMPTLLHLDASPRGDLSISRQLSEIVRFHKIGGPEVLQLDELPLPEPGIGEVRLRVKAIGLSPNFSSF